MIYDCIVAGGGVAGMTAAITLGRRGKRVLLIEQCKELGKKLAATGNGRCNFTNSYYDDNTYRGDAQFAKTVYEQFPYYETLRFMHSIGVLQREREGYYYPYTNQAKTVVQAMLHALNQSHVTLCLDRIVREVTKTEQGWYHVTTSYKSYDGQTVLLACGGKASSYFKQGESYGYELAKQLGHRITPLYPALGSLTVREDMGEMKGVRLSGAICLYSDKALMEPISPLAQGELQLTGEGISGIPAFQVSRYAAKQLGQAGKVYAMVDLLFEYSYQDLGLLLSQAEYDINTTVFTYLCGYVQPVVAAWLLKSCGLSEKSLLKELSKEAWLALMTQVKQLRFEVIGTAGWTKSQVTAGGVATSDIDSYTMESKLSPGCFFAGELLDVDGTCGGYNIQFAISSAMVAVKGIEARIKSG